MRFLVPSLTSTKHSLYLICTSQPLHQWGVYTRAAAWTEKALPNYRARSSANVNWPCSFSISRDGEFLSPQYRVRNFWRGSAGSAASTSSRESRGCNKDLPSGTGNNSTPDYSGYQQQPEKQTPKSSISLLFLWHISDIHSIVSLPHLKYLAP